MLLRRGPKVVKHCPQGHEMEMAWRVCPKCSGRKAHAEVTGRDVTDVTILREAPARPMAAAPAPAAPTWVALLSAASGPFAGHDFEIHPGRYKFGRTPRLEADCTQHAIPDSGMSRDHFILEAGVAAVILRDLGSTNGTFVNGARIERHILHDGDQIRAGESTFGVRLSLKAPSV